MEKVDHDEGQYQDPIDQLIFRHFKPHVVTSPETRRKSTPKLETRDPKPFEESFFLQQIEV